MATVTDSGCPQPALAALTLSRHNGLLKHRHTATPTARHAGRACTRPPSGTHVSGGRIIQDQQSTSADQPSRKRGTELGSSQPTRLRRHWQTAAQKALHVTERLPWLLAMALGVRTLWQVRQWVGQGPSPQRSPAHNHRVAIVWLRNDLRLHDHEALTAAITQCETVVPLYCFDHRDHRPQTDTLSQSPSSFPRCSAHRAQVILSCLSDLKLSLRQRGGDLAVRLGAPEEVLPRLVQRLGAGAVYCHGETTKEDVMVEDQVGIALRRVGAVLHRCWSGCSLYPMDGLQSTLGTSTLDYPSFRRHTEQQPVRDPLPAPECVPHWPRDTGVPAGKLPTLTQLGYRWSQATQSYQQAQHQPAGESHALQQLLQFAASITRQTQQSVATHATHAAGSKPVAPAVTVKKDAGTCQGSVGESTGSSGIPPSFSHNISPWLALGCLSPCQVYHAVMKSDSSSQQVSTAVDMRCTQPPHWLVYELMWRDFFRLILCRSTLPKHTPTALA